MKIISLNNKMIQYLENNSKEASTLLETKKLLQHHIRNSQKICKAFSEDEESKGFLDGMIFSADAINTMLEVEFLKTYYKY